MNPNLYYIIGLLAVVYFVSMYLQKKNQANRKNIEVLNSIEANDSTIRNPRPEVTTEILSEEKRKALAYGAILAYHKQETLLGINPTSNVDSYVIGLKSAWDIGSSEEVHERISQLIKLNRSKEFDAALIDSSKDIEKIKKSIGKALKIDLEQVNQTTSTYGWDIGRAIPVIKWCYWVGYINEKECWDYIHLAADVAREKGKNWTDYTVSFLLGRTMQGFDLDSISVEAYFILNGIKPKFGKAVDDLDVCQKYPFN